MMLHKPERGGVSGTAVCAALLGVSLCAGASSAQMPQSVADGGYARDSEVHDAITPADLDAELIPLRDTLDSIGSFEATYRVEGTNRTGTLQLIFDDEQAYLLLELTTEQTGDCASVSMVADYAPDAGYVDIICPKTKTISRNDMRGEDPIMTVPGGPFLVALKGAMADHGVDILPTCKTVDTPSISLYLNADELRAYVGLTSAPRRTLDSGWLDGRGYADVVSVRDEAGFLVIGCGDERKVVLDTTSGLLVEDRYSCGDEERSRAILLQDWSPLSRHLPYAERIPDYDQFAIGAGLAGDTDPAQVRELQGILSKSLDALVAGQNPAEDDRLAVARQGHAMGNLAGYRRRDGELARSAAARESVMMDLEKVWKPWHKRTIAHESSATLSLKDFLRLVPRSDAFRSYVRPKGDRCDEQVATLQGVVAKAVDQPWREPLSELADSWMTSYQEGFLHGTVQAELDYLREVLEWE